MIIVRVFARHPAIKGLVHHDKTHAIAQIQKLRCGRIVAGADGVDPTLAQNLQFSFQGASIDGCAQCAEIVMFTNAVEFELSSIEEKSICNREF